MIEEMWTSFIIWQYNVINNKIIVSGIGLKHVFKKKMGQELDKNTRYK